MTRKLWQFPWGYPESALFVACIALVGFMLQLNIGHFDFGLLHAPANFIALAILIGLIILGVFFQRSPLMRWVAGIPLAVTLTVALLLLGLYMELTPQLRHLPEHATDLVSRLGFRMVTSSWPFVLLYSLTLIILGIATLKRLLRFSRRDITFACNHLGLWILLVSAGFGAADMVRVVMRVDIGKTEWHSEDGVLALPIAITLNDFKMEEYPPNLTILDRREQTDSPSEDKPQPKRKQAFFQIDPKRPEGRLGDWDITLDEYLHTAVRKDGEYSLNPMPESVPAARVTARNRITGDTKSGWVAMSGNIPEFFSMLPLDEHRVLTMTQAEPKHWASKVTITPRDGNPIDAVIEVNKPASIGNWMIYQYGYDKDLGKISPWSRLELVYDPWLLPARIGMGLMAIGALLLAWNGASRRRSIK